MDTIYYNNYIRRRSIGVICVYIINVLRHYAVVFAVILTFVVVVVVVIQCAASLL